MGSEMCIRDRFIIKGAIKEAGLLFLLNKYIANKTGVYPFGENFNVRNAPKTHTKLIKLCRDKIPSDQMPLLVGVGDTVTSVKDDKDNSWLRGGSDRGFLSLIQRLGESYKKDNQVVFVNSCNKQVLRPRINAVSYTHLTLPTIYSV